MHAVEAHVLVLEALSKELVEIRLLALRRSPRRLSETMARLEYQQAATARTLVCA